MLYIKMNSVTQSKPFYDVYALIYVMNEFIPCMDTKEDVFLLTKKIWELNDDDEIKSVLKDIFG